MLKKHSKIILFLSFFSANSSLIQADEPQIDSCSLTTNLTINDQQTKTDLALFNLLKNLDPQNNELNDLIKSHFNTDNQEVIDFIAYHTDHINLAVSIFKKHFNDNEIQQILDFHASEVGQKFGLLFPNVIQDYKQALEDKIQEIKAAIIAYAKEHQETV